MLSGALPAAAAWYGTVLRESGAMLSQADTVPLASSRASEEREAPALDSLLQSLPVGLVHCHLIRDRQGRTSDIEVRSANATAAVLLSLAPDSLKLMHADDLARAVPSLSESWPAWLAELGGVAAAGASLRRHVPLGARGELAITAYRIGPDDCGLLITGTEEPPVVVASAPATAPDPGSPPLADAVALIGRDFRFVATNAAYAALVGRRQSELTGMPAAEVLGEDLFEREMRPLLQAAFAGEAVALSTRRYHHRLGSERYFEVRYSPVRGSAPVAFVAALLTDVTEAVQRDREHALLLELLRLLNLPTSCADLCRDFVDLVRAHTGCEAVALCLLEDRKLRYSESSGFATERISRETAFENDHMATDIVESLCSEVVHGAFAPGGPDTTELGGFWTNSLTAWLASVDEARLPLGVGAAANASGFESVAIVPVGNDPKLGLVLLCDRRPGLFDKRQVALLERVAASLALGIGSRRARETVHAEEADLQELIERSLDGIAVTDTAGIIRLWNHAQSEITGVPADEAVGQPLWSLWHAILPPERRGPLAIETLRQMTLGQPSGADAGEGRGRRLEWEILRPDGQRRTIETTSFSVRGGERGRVWTVSRDVTDQRQAEEVLGRSKLRYRRLFGESAQGFALYEVIFAPDGQPADYRCIDVNNAFETLTGASAAEMLGKTISEAAPSIAPEWLELYRRVVTTSVPERLEGHFAGLDSRVIVRAFSPERGQLAVILETAADSMPGGVTPGAGAVAAGAAATAVPEPSSKEAVPKLDDILDHEALLSLFEDVHPVTKVAIAITDLEGRAVLTHGFHDVCARFHRVHPETAAKCEYSDAMLSRGIGPGTVKMYRCINNLWSSGTPIIVAGRHIGNLLIGQFFFDDETIDYEFYRRQARRYGFNEAEYIAALDRVPRLSRTSVDSILAFYGRLAVLVSSLTHSNLRLSRALAERDRLLAEVQHSEERYRNVVENAEECIYVTQNGLIQFANRRAAETIGYPLEKLLGVAADQFIHPDDRESVANMHLRRLGSRSEPSSYTLRFIRGDGAVRWAALSVVPIEWEGQPATLNFASDITERKLAEDTAAVSQARFQRLAETIPLGIMEIDSDGRIQYVNQAFLRTHACTHDQVLGSHIWDHAVEPMPVRDLFERLRAEQPPPVPWLGQARTGDGRILDIRVDWDYRWAPDGSLEGMTATIADITAQRQLEAQLLQAQKMESIGRLAGGVAHDFNNLLTAISGYTEFVLEELGPSHRARADIEEVLRNTERASNLTRQLLAFSRRQAMTIRPVDLNALMMDLGRLLRRLIGEHIDLVLLPGESLTMVAADPAQIEQVIVNLTVNARDAMPSGGRLTIQTSMAPLPPGVAASRGEPVDKQYALVEVTDTGMGMSGEVLEHLFEPFFTTKEPDKGTGLGLATVYGVVTQHGGHIAAESKPGEGSTFRIYLPATETPADRGEPLRAEEGRRGDGETILIVEDEPQVRAVERRALQRLGYSVIEATNGEEGLRVVQGLSRPPDLIVTDMVMPRMGGMEMAAKLREAYPQLRYLFTSGYTDDVQALMTATGSGHYLHKPFSAQDLADAVRAALEAPPASSRAGDA